MRNVKTVFDLPSLEAKERLESILSDIYSIVDDKRFLEAFKPVKSGVIKDSNDIEKVLEENDYKSKIKGLIELFIKDKYNAVINILATLFCSDFEHYSKKSINQICMDINSLSQSNKNQLLSFFTQRH